ncbi:hypothetical protein FA95DRAFT_1555357 [Auriscalpium vulgare]|uniref:Uncharacterized protein n=1 Tax=Auriscalpium vulgare TaxID=40419 RepID=A0ACB8S3H8_9AGAM|nr:hypothetical protein FA95DRAFT_1555357 [Auriscalpium vulgare]
MTETALARTAAAGVVKRLLHATECGTSWRQRRYPSASVGTAAMTLTVLRALCVQILMPASLSVN